MVGHCNCSESVLISAVFTWSVRQSGGSVALRLIRGWSVQCGHGH